MPTNSFKEKAQTYKYLDYFLTITDKTITFKNDLSFTHHFKPFKFHLSEKHGIFVQETNSNKIYHLKHPFDIAECLFTTPNLFLFVSDRFYITLNKNQIDFIDSCKFTTLNSVYINEEIGTIISYFTYIFVTTRTKICVIDLNAEIPSIVNTYNITHSEIEMEPIEYEIKNNKRCLVVDKENNEDSKRFSECSIDNVVDSKTFSISFIDCLLFIDKIVFYKNSIVFEGDKSYKIDDFHFKLASCMNDGEKIVFFRAILSGNDFKEVLTKHNFSIQSKIYINSYLEYEFFFNNHKLFFDSKSKKDYELYYSKLPFDVFKKLLSLTYFIDKQSCKKIFTYNETILNNFQLKEKDKSRIYNKVIYLQTGESKIVENTNIIPFCHNSSLFQSDRNPLLESTIPLPYKIILSNHFPHNFLIKLVPQTYFTNSLDLDRISDMLYKDSRLIEVKRLFDEKELVDVDFDENDLEKKRVNSYINRVSSNIGQSYFYCGIENQTKIEKIENLVFKNKNVQIEILKHQKDWPDFIYGCNQVLKTKIFNDDYASVSLHNSKNFSDNFYTELVNNFESIPFHKEKEGFSLAGAIFALGLNKKITEEISNHYFQSKDEIVVFSTIISYSITKKHNKNNFYEMTLLEILQNGDSLLLKTAAILGLGFINYYTNNSEIIQTLIQEVNRYGAFDSTKNKGNKIWYTENYRVFCTLSLSLVCNEKTRYIKLKDSFCELLLNGLIFTKSKNKKVILRIQRDDDSKLEEVFYSSLFEKLIMFDQDGQSVLNEVLFDGKNDLVSLYRKSGKIFYIAFKLLSDNNGLEYDEILIKLYELCLDYEIKLSINPDFKIIFDTILITLSILKSGSSDLNIMRILRRLLKKTEDTTYLTEIFDFSSNSGDSKQFGLRFGDLMKYKMCLGVLCSGHGLFGLKVDKECIFNIIASFYINFPLSTFDQEYFNVFRYFLCMNFEQLRFISQTHKLHVSNESKNSYYTHVNDFNAFFSEQYKKLDIYQKKICLDILCDYFEKNENRIGFTAFKKAAASFYVNNL